MYKKIITVIIFLSSLTLAQAIGPKASIPQINYDYTHVPKGEKLSHTYSIFNGGDEPLSLTDLRTSCKCIAASLNKNELAPTDSAKLTVEYTNTGNSQDLDNYVTIRTNDPSNPELRIYITRVTPGTAPTLSGMPNDSSGGKHVSAPPSIYFPEDTHNFGVMKQGSVGDHIFKFQNKGGSALIIKDITTSCGCTAALVKSKEIAPGGEGELRVQFDSSGKIGKLSRSVTLYTNDPKHIEKTIIIYADVVTETK